MIHGGAFRKWARRLKRPALSAVLLAGVGAYVLHLPAVRPYFLNGFFAEETKPPRVVELVGPPAGRRFVCTNRRVAIEFAMAEVLVRIDVAIDNQVRAGLNADLLREYRKQAEQGQPTKRRLCGVPTFIAADMLASGRATIRDVATGELVRHVIVHHVACGDALRGVYRSGWRVRLFVREGGQVRWPTKQGDDWGPDVVLESVDSRWSANYVI